MSISNKERRVELHYYTNDESHTMSALVLNRCEWELINLLKEISGEIGVAISIESEALSEGGIRHYFRILLDSERRDAAITSETVAALLILFLSIPVNIGIAALNNYVFSDPEKEKLEKENLKLSIENQKLDIQIKQEQLIDIKEENEGQKNRSDEKEAEKLIPMQLITEISEIAPELVVHCLGKIYDSAKTIKRRSNFYEQLSKEQKVSGLSINDLSKKNMRERDNAVVDRSEFTKYVLSSNKLESIIDESAIIEIVSPVLKKGKYQWRGIYNSEILNFNMNSNEFKTKVQMGDIEFKNGTCIICVLEMPRIINNLGEAIVTSYNVKRVLSYYDMDNVLTETKEGKIYRKKKDVDIAQLDLFYNETDSTKSTAINDKPSQ